jgi:carboxylesterase
MPGAEPFFFPGGRTGCLVLHGLTGTPQEVRELGEHLAAQGYTVLGPRLPHHGTDPADLIRSRWQDWYLAAEDALRLLQAQCDQLFLVGFSMGGSTALLLATRHPVRAIAALSTPVFLHPDWRLRMARWIWWIYRYSYRGEEDDSWVDPGAPERRVDYKARPVRAVLEFKDYLEVVRAVLPQVTAPVLLMHSRTDLTVPPENMDTIYQLIGSTEKTKIWIDESDHAITEDIARHEVFRSVSSFLSKHASD